MGQNSSKRRSYTPGVDKNTEVATSPRVNGDVKANGSIEVHGEHDVSGVEPTTPTSPTSVTSTSSTGKKEKKKRFRVGFSLKRTPSGRWSRKKRTTQNGTRPVSCPVPVKEEQEETPGRPQSLFLDELEIHEEDSKIETVDLSDHEEGGKSKKGGKHAPKAPEKTKGKRGSKKNSSGKKKKEKQNSKKDKKKKQQKEKAADEAAAAAATPAVAETKVEEATTTQTEAASDTKEPETKVETSAESPQQPEAEIEAVASSIVTETVNIAQERLRAEAAEEAATTVTTATDATTTDVTASAAIASTLPEPSTTDIPQPSVSVEITPVEPADVSAEAATESTEASIECPKQVEVVEEMFEAKSEATESAAIVAEEIIAQVMDKPLETVPKVPEDKPEEQPEEIQEESQVSVPSVDVPSVEMTTESVNVSVAASEGDNSCLDVTDSSISKEAAEAVALAEKSEAEINQLVATSTASVAKADINATDDNNEIPSVSVEVKSEDSVKAQTLDSDAQVVVESPVKLTSSQSLQIAASSNDTQEEQAKEAPEASAAPVESVSKRDEKEDVEAVAKETVEDIVAAAVKSVDGEKQNENEDVKTQENEEQTKTDSDKSGSDSENEKAHKAELEKERREKERQEKERLKKQKEEEKAKEKERIKEEKKKKAEQKAAEKAEKEKAKGEKKLKVPKKLSSWFHKKDKQPKTIAEMDIEAPEKDPASPGESSSTPESPASPVSEQDVENAVSPVAEAPVESQPSASSPAPNESLSVDVSVEPLVATQVHNAESSPDSNEATASPTSQESPNSPTSDTSEPTSPTSDSDKGSGASGILKKISLGPRLRTAILRKKSSGASDSGQDEKRLSLTQPKTVESTEITPPPRKLRPRKPVEQYSPITPGAHNKSTPTDLSPKSPVSNDDSALDTSVQSDPEPSDSLKTSVNDSGVGDLTSPEGDGEVAVPNCTEQTVIEEVIEVAQSASVSCAPPTSLPSENTPDKQEVTKTESEDVSSAVKEDGTPLRPQMNLDLSKDDNTSDAEQEHSTNEKDYVSPLNSPTLVSTACIVLRSTSTEDSVPPTEQPNAADLVPPPISSAAVAEQSDDSIVASALSEIKDNAESKLEAAVENCNISLTSPSSPISSSSQQVDSNQEIPENVTEVAAAPSSDDEEEGLQQQEYVVVCSAQTLSDENVIQPSKPEVVQPQGTSEIPSSQDKQDELANEKEPQPQVRTIAEYEIGISSESAKDQPSVRTINEFQIGICEEPQKSSETEEHQEVSATTETSPKDSETPSEEQEEVNKNGNVNEEDQEDSSSDKTLTTEENGAENSSSNGTEEAAQDDAETTLKLDDSNEGLVADPQPAQEDQEKDADHHKENGVAEDEKNAKEDDNDNASSEKANAEDGGVVAESVNDKNHQKENISDGEGKELKNGNNNDNCEGGKTGPTDTIEAYLKIQYAEHGVGVNGNGENAGDVVVVNGDKGEISNSSPAITVQTSSEQSQPVEEATE